MAEPYRFGGPIPEQVKRMASRRAYRSSESFATLSVFGASVLRKRLRQLLLLRKLHLFETKAGGTAQAIAHDGVPIGKMGDMWPVVNNRHCAVSFCAKYAPCGCH